MVGKFLLAKGLPGCSIWLQWDTVQLDIEPLQGVLCQICADLLHLQFREIPGLLQTNVQLPSAKQTDHEFQSRAQEHQVALKHTAVSHERLLAVLLRSSTKTEADRSFVPLENQALRVYDATSYLLYFTIFSVGPAVLFHTKFSSHYIAKTFLPPKSNLVSHTALFIKLIKLFFIAEDTQF